jgi:outer membrane protein
MTSQRLIAASFIASTLFPLAAMAGGPPDAPKTDWNITMGAGAVYAPAFVGSKDYQLIGFPDLKFEYKDKFFASVGEGVGYNVINGSGWRVGPIAKYAFQRQENGKNPFRVAGKASTALRGLGDVDGTLELGGFVEYSYEPFTYKVELRQGVDGHEGMIGETSLNYTGSIDRFGPPIFYAFGPRATFGDSNYNNAYYGINQTQSANSGLSRYSADAGLVSYGVGGFISLPVSDSVSVSAFGGYDRLGSEVADSPLIKERGSENQFVSGLSVSYQLGY